jgi:phage terminase large subunit-like protein
MEMGLRLGAHPRCVATTTPRPIPLIRELVADPDCVVTKGNTYDNEQNLAQPFIQRVLRRYEGTRLGRQELHAEILDDVVGALWSRQLLDKTRRRAAGYLLRVAVGVDPQGTKSLDEDGGDKHETGIVVAGKGVDEQGYVLGDYSGNYSPNEWASAAIKAYHDHEANCIVAEVNYGGDMVAHTIRTVDPTVNVVVVRASRGAGKARRAEPIVSLYEQGRVHHVGLLPELEDEMCTWTEDGGQPSPNRLDGAVWALWKLFIDADEDYPHYDPGRHTYAVPAPQTRRVA